MLETIQKDVRRIQTQLQALGVRVPPVRLNIALAGVAAGHQDGCIWVPLWQGCRFLHKRKRSLRTLRHEYGHAYLMAWWTHIGAEATQVFGDFHQQYPGRVFLFTRWVRARRPSGYVSAYASTHPLEDFAETFEWVVRHDLCPPLTPHDAVLQRKLDFMGHALSNQSTR